MDRRIGNLIALTVTVVWAISFVADIAMRTYEPSPYIHGIMMMIAGSFFGSSIVSRGGKDK